MFQEVLNHRAQNKYAVDDFLEQLRNKKYDDGVSVTDEEITGLSIALMLAGYHTSNITSSWLGIQLLTHPKVLEEVMKEQEKINADNGPLDFQKVKDMEYLNNCMTETLRMRPPIILVWRLAMQDFKYKQYVIPKGSLVCVSPAVHGRNESIYTKPNEYDPWRFGPGRLEGNDVPCSFLAFSTGAHYCLGEKFAFLQVKTIWSVILRKYNVTLEGTEKDYPVDNTTLMAGPIKPVTVLFKRKK